LLLICKKYKAEVIGIISIDGSYFGPSAISKIEKAKQSGNEYLIHYVQYIPIKKLTMPVPTICLRNLKQNSPDTLKYTDESENKKYTIKYYVEKGHFLHVSIPDEIITAILEIKG